MEKEIINSRAIKKLLVQKARDMQILRKARQTVKHVLRDSFWSVYGLQEKNPAIPLKPKEILFVCLGNICRSGYAHHYVASRFQRDNQELKVFSAGLHVKDAGSPQTAISAAKSRGVNLAGHIPKQVDAEMIETADMVLAMEPKQIRLLRNRFPEYSDKFFLLTFFEGESVSQYRGWSRYHIKDPYGKSSDEFAECFARIERCVDGLMSGITDTRG
ncbi:arsenate reductase/protein-tyrosine-phosphatase family protein [Desulfopila inferna]|uniref:arsenate reductase/protein-tyrosine-phosphatase family protein n=1 Tax=Desulfopila inferna TaxID=468528 RepID=UPI001963E2B6|nr:hypothetical protein [Desulfopila inferna]MBM9605746.1 hypothetical protein [Desulfopila inferna]